MRDLPHLDLALGRGRLAWGHMNAPEVVRSDPEPAAGTVGEQPSRAAGLLLTEPAAEAFGARLVRREAGVLRDLIDERFILRSLKA